MHASRWLRPAVAMLAAVALAAAGCGREEEGGGGGAAAAPGVTADSIKLGGSYPFSGPASAYGNIGRGATAYFDYVNSKGGVHGRKIEFVTLDDAYEPPRAVNNARRLITQEKVFALFQTLGTPNNLAIWDYVNQQKVPHLFVATGASDWGKDPKTHPWTIGWQPDYVTEANAYAGYLKQEKPNAKIAVLYQNDGFGKDLLGGFDKAIEGSNIRIVAREAYEVTDPTVAPQVGKLARSDADTFLNITTPKFAAQAIDAIAKSDWRPLHILANVSASKTLVLQPVGLDDAKGIISSAYYKDPEDPRWRDDPAMKEYKTQLKRFARRADPNDSFHVFGWAAAQTMVKALEEAGENLTRDRIMEVVRSMDFELPILLPGLKVETSENDGYPIQSVQMQRFDGRNWRAFGEIFSSEEGTT